MIRIQVAIQEGVQGDTSPLARVGNVPIIASFSRNLLQTIPKAFSYLVQETS